MHRENTLCEELRLQGSRGDISRDVDKQREGIILVPSGTRSSRIRRRAIPQVLPINRVISGASSVESCLSDAPTESEGASSAGNARNTAVCTWCAHYNCSCWLHAIESQIGAIMQDVLTIDSEISRIDHKLRMVPETSRRMSLDCGLRPEYQAARRASLPMFKPRIVVPIEASSRPGVRRFTRLSHQWDFA
jgi:hypothetical protein